MTDRISPTMGEFREAREIVENSLTRAEEEFPLERDVVIDIGWEGDDFFVEAMDGVSGFASHPNRIELGFNTAAEGWKEALKSTAVHEYAHVWGYERRGRESRKKWEYIIEEAFTQHMAKQLVPEYRSPWWTKHSIQNVATYWEPIKKDELDRDSEEAGPIYINLDKGGYPLGLGYSLSFQLGQELLAEHDLNDFPTLSKPELVRVGDHLYQNDG